MNRAAPGISSRAISRRPPRVLQPTRMPRAKAAPPTDYSALPTEAQNPQSAYLDTMPAEEVVKLMLDEEAQAVRAVRARHKEIAQAAGWWRTSWRRGGRLIYVGAGTSGRLGVLDAAECVPTFGVPPSRVLGVIAGGPRGADPVGRGGRGQPPRGRAAAAPGGGGAGGRRVRHRRVGGHPLLARGPRVRPLPPRRHHLRHLHAPRAAATSGPSPIWSSSSAPGPR
jgi:hypothetical protein